MTIAEVSRQFDITPDTLRYYERIGLIPPVPRTKSGIRDYDQTSCSWIEFIKCMRAAGLQIEALIEYVALFQQGDSTIGARKALLLEQRDQLEERIATMQQTLERSTTRLKTTETASPKNPSCAVKPKTDCTNTSPPQSSPAGELCVFVLFFTSFHRFFFGILSPLPRVFENIPLVQSLIIYQIYCFIPLILTVDACYLVWYIGRRNKNLTKKCAKPAPNRTTLLIG